MKVSVDLINGLRAIDTRVGIVRGMIAGEMVRNIDREMQEGVGSQMTGNMQQAETSKDTAKASIDSFVEQLRGRMHRAIDSGVRVKIDLKDALRVQLSRPSFRLLQGPLTLEGDTPIAVVVTIGGD